MMMMMMMTQSCWTALQYKSANFKLGSRATFPIKLTVNHCFCRIHTKTRMLEDGSCDRRGSMYLEGTSCE